MTDDNRMADFIGAIHFIHEISADLDWALHALKTVDDLYATDKAYRSLRLGLLVDLGIQHQRQDILTSAINDIKEVISADPETHPDWLVFELGYYLGTAYQALSSLTEADLISPERQLLQLSKRAYQACIKNKARAVFAAILPRAHVNLGNVLSALGRHFEALLHYESALKVDSEFAMAIWK